MSIEVSAERSITETDAAILVELADGREVWIPFSQCSKILRRPDGSIVVNVTQWFAAKEDLL